MNNFDNHLLAKNLYKEGYVYYLSNKLDKALEYFKKSLQIWPTAEGYAYYGWALSWNKQYEEAIKNCQLGINLDPDFGNNYNDIGAYLICLKRIDEAIEYLELALGASKYNSRHFPYYNLGIIEESKGNWFKAVKFFRKSLDIEPNFSLSKKAYYKVQGILN